MKRLVSLVGWPLLLGTSHASPRTDDLDTKASAGDVAQRVATYATALGSAPQDGLLTDEFNVLVVHYCEAARALAAAAIADVAPKPADRLIRLGAAREAMSRCPEDLPTVVRIGDAMEQAAVAGWEAEVPALEPESVLGAWLAAAHWVHDLEGERALWKRFDAWTATLRTRFESAERAAGPSRPHSAWFFGTLASRTGSAAAPPALPAVDWSYTQGAAGADAAPGVPTLCADLAAAMVPAASVPAAGPSAHSVNLQITLTGCETKSADARDTGREIRQVMGPVDETHEECREESVPTLVTGTQTSCNQFGLNCYSYMVGKYVGVSRTVCSPVTVTVVKLHDEEVAFEGVRPGTGLDVRYRLSLSMNGETWSTNEVSTFAAMSGKVLPDPVAAGSVESERPNVGAAVGLARSGLASAVASEVRLAVFAQLARQRTEVARRAEAAGDQAGAREAWLVLATGPDASAAQAAWKTIAQGEKLGAPALESVLRSDFTRAAPRSFSLYPWLYDRRRINLESAAAVLRYGVPPISTRAVLQFAAFSAIPSQPDRRAIFTSAMGSLSPSLYLRDDGFGPGYHDDLEFGAQVGVRISKTYAYPGSPAAGEENESRLAGGYLASYTGLLGYRGRTLGLFAGARGQYSGLRIGDAHTAGAALPLVGRLEIRFAEDKPMIAQGWAFDATRFSETPRSLGGSLELPLVTNVALYARYERRQLEAQFGGLDKDDRVSAGRRLVTVAGLGVSLSVR